MGKLHGRSIPRGLVVVLAVLAMTITFAVPGLTVGASTFDTTDGNMILADGDGGGPDTADTKDWENAPSLDPVTDQVSGQNDDAYKGGAKHDDICPAVAAGGIPPNKDDLLRFYVSHETVSANTFLYLGWVRYLARESSASAHIDFEFNQGTTACSATNKLIIRTPGDILIFYDLEGGGNPVLSLAKWILAPDDIPTDYACVGAGSGTTATGCWGGPNGALIPLTGLGLADGAINSGSIADTVTPGASPLPFSREFGEAGINITSFLPPGDCGGFSKANLGSRSSGNSADSTMKDFVLGDVSINNCGSLKIKKVDPDGGPLAGAKFKVYKSDGDAAFEPGTGDTQIGKNGADSSAAGAECLTTADGIGDCIYTNLLVGTRYWIDETQAPPGFNPPNPTYVLSGAIVAGSETLVTRTDTPALGDVKIVKRDDAGNLLGNVAFTLVGTSTTGASVSVGCTTSTTAGADFGTCTILNVPVGTGYTLDEGAMPTGYSRDPLFPKTVNVVSGGVANNTFGAANPRQHRVIVIVCHEGTDTLYSTTDNVNLGGVSKTSISAVPSPLAAKSVTPQDLCNIGGAEYDHLGHTPGSPSPSPYPATVAIPGH